MEQLNNNLKHLIDFMKKAAECGTAMAFVTPCCYIDYLTKLYTGDGSSNSYKKFIREILYDANPAYKEFEFSCGKADLDIQIYHILRCGIVHSFSLVGDEQSKKNGGRDRSIILGHKGKEKEGVYHLSSYSDNNIENACVFILEDFIDDLEKATEILFKKAEIDSNIKMNIENWSFKHPFIGSLS
jgi:hypothetical protein